MEFYFMNYILYVSLEEEIITLLYYFYACYSFLGCLIFLLYKNMRELEYLPYGIINIYEFSNDGIKIVQEENLEVKISGYEII